MLSVANMLQEGYQRHRSGDLLTAEQHYRSILDLNPRQSDALHLLGVVHQQRGDAKSAAELIRRAIVENPRSAVFHSNLAAAEMALGDLNAARGCLTEAVRLDPKLADAQNNLAMVLQELERVDVARAASPQQPQDGDHSQSQSRFEKSDRPDRRVDASHWSNWLADNASLRWDPELTTHSASRGEYTMGRYRFARDLFARRRVLDVGCGTGYGSNILKETAQSVHGVDVCPEAVEFANQKYGSDSVRFQRSFAESLPFEDNVFEAVVCFEVLEHLLSPRSALREFVRVLTPGGIAVVSVPNAWGFTRHHLVDTDLQFLKTATAECFEETEFYYNNSAEFQSDAPTGIGLLTEIDPSAAECLVAVCRKPRDLNGNSDRVADLLEDAYELAFKRHDAYSNVAAQRYGLLPTNESTVGLPQVKPGSRISLEAETSTGPVEQVVLRIEADVLADESQGLTVQLPELPLKHPATAQFHIHYADGSVGTCPPVRLIPRHDAA